MVTNDPVNHPRHYTSHPSGVECIQITSHMGFNLGNALKYIWRCDLKQDAVEDLRKAQWYISQEIAKRIRVNNEVKIHTAAGVDGIPGPVLEVPNGGNIDKECGK